MFMPKDKTKKRKVTAKQMEAQLAKIALLVKRIAEADLVKEQYPFEDAIAERNKWVEEARALIESAKAMSAT